MILLIDDVPLKQDIACTQEQPQNGQRKNIAVVSRLVVTKVSGVKSLIFKQPFLRSESHSCYCGDDREKASPLIHPLLEAGEDEFSRFETSLGTISRLI